MRNPIHILVIGTLPPPNTGTTLLLKTLVDGLSERQDVVATVINAGGIRKQGLKGAFRFLKAIADIAAAARKVDIVTVHSATAGLHVLGPTVVLLARLVGKPVIVRKYGGTDVRRYGWLRRNLILWTCRRATLYLAETKEQVHVAGELGIPSVRWFPNNRTLRYTGKRSGNTTNNYGRFVFLGEIRKEKGILQIIEACNHFGEGVVVDLYGKIGFDISKEILAEQHNVHFKGDLAPERVCSILSKYDALLLPSFHPGEGYPGAILAAYEVGLPVICTRWQYLPEIVDKTSGILVEPRDSDALFHAMKRLIDDKDLHARLREGAWKRREEYSSETWVERFVEYCREVAGYSGQPDPPAT